MSKLSRFLQSRIFWIQSISISAIALLLVIGFSYAWGTPDNTSVPLKVGIGITTPHRLLHLYQDSGNNAELDIQSVAGANNHWGIYNDRGTNQLRFWQGDNRLTITPDGRVGIGTVGPKAKLDVNGTIKTKSPVDPNDVATKEYVDAAGSGSSGGYPACKIECVQSNIDCPTDFPREIATTKGTGCLYKPRYYQIGSQIYKIEGVSKGIRGEDFEHILFWNNDKGNWNNIGINAFCKDKEGDPTVELKSTCHICCK